jgi:hypothetical protein
VGHLGHGGDTLKKRDRNIIENTNTYNLYYSRLRDYALSMFQWNNLPPSINERFMELTLYRDGKIAFFEDTGIGYLSLPVSDKGPVNYYNEALEYQIYSYDYQTTRTPDNAVIIWNNYSRIPIHPFVQEYARRLAEIQRTIDVNVFAQKTPVIILVDDNQRITMENVYHQYEGNKPVIFGNKQGFDLENVKVLKTDAPYVADKLQVLKNEIWNEAMTFLGVGNAKQDKKERLVSDEVSANDEQIQGARYIMLKARQEACEKINKMFGLDISVEFKLDIDNEPEEAQNED